MPSQFADADSWQARYRGTRPLTRRRARSSFSARYSSAAPPSRTRTRSLLVKLYGEPKGRAVGYAEAFELNQYGSPATVDQLKQMFPTFARSEGLTRTNLHQLSQVFRGKTVPASAGRYHQYDLARRSPSGLRRSLARHHRFRWLLTACPELATDNFTGN